MAYLAKHFSNKFGNLYSYDTTTFKIEDFKKHMNEVLEYVKLVNITIPSGDIQSGDGSVKICIGVPFSNDFIWEVLEFAKSRDVNLKYKKANSSTSYDNAIKFIKAGLEQNIPVALLMWENSNLPQYSMHWMTITSLSQDTITEKYYVTVSTWGENHKLDLDFIWNNDDFLKNNSLLYFY